MKLYFSPGACSMSPHIVLQEAGLPYTTEQVDLRTKVTAGGADFKAINPKGYVPVLELGEGVRLTEVSAVVQYVADQAPASKLAAPAGSLERYRQLEWLNFIGTELHKAFAPLFTPGTSEEHKQYARDYLNRRFAYVDSQLAGKDYLTGADFTVADAYLFTVSNWTAMLKIDIAPFSHLAAFIQRVAARPAVRQVMADEGLLGQQGKD